MNKIKFEKYHGCGNDFLFIEGDIEKDYSLIAQKMCNRFTGIGADGMFVVNPNKLTMMLYNQDGSVANMCGNGIRCLAYYFVRHQMTNEDVFEIETLDGIKTINIISKEPFICKVDMGSYSFDKEKMGFNSSEDMLNFEVELNNQKYLTHSLFLGTYHTVIYMPKVEYGLYPELGKMINEHKVFKYGTNVDFVEVVDRNTLKVNTYERGVGFTYACGTGSTSSYVISKFFNKCDNPVQIILPYGLLQISEEDGKLYMQGPATYIGSGEM